MRKRRVRQLELCDREMFGDLVYTCQNAACDQFTSPHVPNIRTRAFSASFFQPEKVSSAQEKEKRRASALLDQLLVDIYNGSVNSTDYNSATSSRSKGLQRLQADELKDKDISTLASITQKLQEHVCKTGSVLVRHLKRRDALRRQRDAHCDVVTCHLRKHASRCPAANNVPLECVSENVLMSGFLQSFKKPSPTPNDQKLAGFPDLADMRFSIEPSSGDTSFSQWHSAMKLVAQLPEGIPPEFRSRLWLALADRHLSSRKVDWTKVERNCFSEWSHPADSELGVQIVKDLHRTGCSLFCGEDGQENQALLKRVLLAYARWNKDVGYCQGFNMLAALILQVTDKSETDALKLMIYLIEGVLPDSYFADSLRGLSVDMAVFRELLRTRLPRLSKHLDALQIAAKDGTTSYEPPLTNVFTMQWFLTLFCNCLPQPTVLRVWDLILLEGNEILLRTALAIWQALAERIVAVRSADEFYCIMGVLTREMLEFGLVDANSLIKSVVAIGPLKELKTLRDHYLYNINPWGSVPLKSESSNKQMKVYSKEKLALDIGMLKKQYTKLKQRQRQAHIIFNAAIARQPQRVAPVAMNHLLLGKSALVSAKSKRLGPPKGSIPPARHQPPTTLHWKDAPRQSSSSSSSDTELCDDPDDCHSGDESIPKVDELPDDNLPTSSDKILMIDESKISIDESINTTGDSILMTEDNTQNNVTLLESKELSANSAPVEENLLDFESELPEVSPTNNLSTKLETIINAPIHPPTSDIFDIKTKDEAKSEIQDINLPTYDVCDSVGSEDESTEFETFLEERIRSLKNFTDICETSDELPEDLGRLHLGRKNSERALQIIHENSLILTRILQCQSRFSPSPPISDSETALSPVTTESKTIENCDIDEIVRNIFEKELGQTETPNVSSEITPTNESCATEESSTTESIKKLDNVQSDTTNSDVNNESTVTEETKLAQSSELKTNLEETFNTSPAKQIKDKFEHMQTNMMEASKYLEDYRNKQEIKIESTKENTMQLNLDINQSINLDVNLLNLDDSSEIIDVHNSSNNDEKDSVDYFCKTEFFKQAPDTDVSNEKEATLLNVNELLNNTNIREEFDVKETSTKLDLIEVKESPKKKELDLNLIEVNDSPKKKELDLNLIEAKEFLKEYQNRQDAKLEAARNQSEEMIDTLVVPCSENKNKKYERSSSAEAFENMQIQLIEASKYLEDYRMKKEQEEKNVEPNTPQKEDSVTDTIDFKIESVDNDNDMSVDDNLQNAAQSSKYETMFEFGKNLDKKFNSLILNQSNTCLQNKRSVSEESRNFSVEESKPLSVSQLGSPVSPISPTINFKKKSPSRSPLLSPTSETQSMSTSENGNLKSPSRIYNPFPVQLSLRQNKDVPMRLGLYKK